MNIHEYQAKELLSRHRVPVPPEVACTTPEEAQAAAEKFACSPERPVVVKSQIHAGGRGKGTFKNGMQGGVKVCRDPQEVFAKSKSMLGNVLVTKQTGPEGRTVNRVLVTPAQKILKEFYLAVLLDRLTGRPIVMASSEGGMDIEEVAARTPERIHRESIDPALGMMPYQGRKLAQALGLPDAVFQAAVGLILGVYQAWWECDATLVEINPMGLVQSPEGKPALLALDAKMVVEDNALFRHPEIEAMRDLAEEAPLEIEASKHDLNYIKLDGNIACLVNGAGLAMATMDIIQYYGGQPANFLDVGGGATKEQVTAAFRIIMSDPHVKGILVNIFGGIMQCDVIATGIVAAVKETHLALPLVVRLEGNRVELGKQILAQAGLALTSADSLAEAAEKIVKAVAR